MATKPCGVVLHLNKLKLVELVRKEITKEVIDKHTQRMKQQLLSVHSQLKYC